MSGARWPAASRSRLTAGLSTYAYAGFRGDRPVSYAIYSMGSGGENATIRLLDGLAVDPPAWRDLLGLLSMHSTDAGSIDFYVPVDSPIRLLLPEANKGYVQPSLMLRVVDVEGFLNSLGNPGGKPGERATEAPASEERLLLEVRDPDCSWNNGVFEVMVGQNVCAERFGSGKSTAPTRPPLSTDIATFSQMAAGYLTPVVAADLGRLEVIDPAALNTLTRVLPGRTTFTADFY